MNIIHMLPGTGTYHCGGCERDAALIRSMRRRGHDVLCMPLYLPVVVDGPDPADTPIFFGGINAYLQQKSRFFRNTPPWLDRLLDRPGLLRWAARRSDMTKAHDLGALTVSMLRGRDGNQVKEVDRLCDWLRHEMHPDIVCFSNALLLGMAGAVKEATGARIACNLQGEDSFLDNLPAPYREQAWEALRQASVPVDVFVPVSDYYLEVMQGRLALDRSRFRRVHNGIDAGGYEAREAPPDPPVVGYLARLSREKGLHRLVEAFIRLAKSGRVPGVRLLAVGVQTAGDRRLEAEMRRDLVQAGLGDAAEFMPNVGRDEKIEFLRRMTVLSVPALYGECFGLYLLEAMACGVPAVQPRHGAFPEVIEATGGGLLYDPEEGPDALAEALAALLTDSPRREALGRKAREAVLSDFSIEAMTDRVLEVYGDLLG